MEVIIYYIIIPIIMLILGIVLIHTDAWKSHWK